MYKFCLKKEVNDISIALTDTEVLHLGRSSLGCPPAPLVYQHHNQEIIKENINVKSVNKNVHGLEKNTLTKLKSMES